MKHSRNKLTDVEALLVRKTASLLPDRLRREGLTLDVHAEVTVGSSIADLVLVARPPRRMISFSRPLTTAESVLLALLRVTGPVSVAKVERLLGIRSGCLLTDPTLKWLTRRRVIRVRGRTVEVNKAWTRKLHIVAVEAKLSRWRDALAQAATYRRYADRVFVALPAHSAAIAFKHAHEFRAAGVGLLRVDHRNVRTLIAGSVSRNHDWRREFIASRLLPRVARSSR